MYPEDSLTQRLNKRLQNGGDGTLGRQFMTSPGTQIRQSMPTVKHKHF